MKKKKKKAKTKKYRSAAVLSMFRVPTMTTKGRIAIATWLRKQATMMVSNGKAYTPGRFTARYLYAE